jgi:hypothetical protein
VFQKGGKVDRTKIEETTTRSKGGVTEQRTDSARTEGTDPFSGQNQWKETNFPQP